MNYKNKALCVYIDRIRKMDQTIEVMGWASSRNGMQEITVWDGEKQIDCTVKRIKRPDVTGENTKELAGFEVRFQDCGSLMVSLCITAAGKEKVIKIDTEEEWFRENKKQKIEKIVNPENNRKRIRSIRDYGCRTALTYMLNDLSTSKKEYNEWRKKHIASEAECERQKRDTFEYQPVISLIVPAYRTNIGYLKEMIESVQNQTYEKWELCIADGGCPDETVKECVTEYQRKDQRIRYAYLNENKGISGNTNEAVYLATGEWIGLIDHDDTVEPDLLYQLVKKMNENRSIDVLYTDEDKMTMNSKTFFEPNFKSDFDIFKLESANYITHFFCVKKEIVDKVGCFDPECDGSQDYDFILRCVEQAEKVGHVAKVLYHWRSHPASTAGNSESKMYCYEAGKRALKKHFKRIGVDCDIENNAFRGYYLPFYGCKEEPLISIVLFGNIKKEACRTTIQSIKKMSGYRNYEFLYGRKNAEKAKGEYLLFIEAGSKMKGFIFETENRKVEDDLEKKAFPYNMIGILNRKNVGAVGARAEDAKGRMLSCVTARHKKYAVEYGYRCKPYEEQAALVYSLMIRKTNTVSLNGMMVKTSVYKQMRGLDLTLQGVLDDVDFCYRLLENGYQIIFDATSRVVSPQKISPEHLAFWRGRKAVEVAECHKKIIMEPDPTQNPNQIMYCGRLLLKK